MSAIYKRELKSYFTSPLGYVIILSYLALYGWFFGQLYSAGLPQTSYVFSSVATILTPFLIPVLTMRLFSEERRQKTDKALFTAPVSLTGIVMGKYLAALTVFLLSQIITVLYQAIFAFNIAVDWVSYLSSLTGTLLMAAAFIALGLFISSLTDVQIVAAVVSMAVSAFLMFFVDGIASGIQAGWLKWVTVALEWISFQGRYYTFINGLFDIANAVYFISFAAVFVFLTVRVQESKRWA